MNSRAIILSGFGINCEEETAAAVRMAGGNPSIVHINNILDGTHSLSDYKALFIPGGFSFGDDLGSGRLLAHVLRYKKDHRGKTLLSSIEDMIANNGFVMGICNGFQVLVALGLLPEGKRASLTFNNSGKFENRWVRLTVSSDAITPALRGISALSLPSRHGEGRLVFENNSDLEELVENGRACLFFCDQSGNRTEKYPENPNGSPLGVTGLCDSSGRIFGLMPHPEAALSILNHPDWPSRTQNKEDTNSCGDGLKIFQNIFSSISGG